MRIQAFSRVVVAATLLLLSAILPQPTAAGSTTSPVEPPRDTSASGPIGCESVDLPGYKPGELLIKFIPGDSAQAMQDLLADRSATAIESLTDGTLQLWQVPEGEELALAHLLSNDPAVKYAEPNYYYFALGAPDDPHYGIYQWAHATIQSAAAWDLTTGSSNITIAVIDTGIDSAHPDLSSKIVAGYDCINEDTVPIDKNGHGTHVSGIAAAATDTAIGIAGMTWHAQIMPVGVLDEDGAGTTSDIVQGITWAYQHGADILNLSLGGIGYSQSMQDAINSAHAAGSLVVAAMGNCRVSCTIGGMTYSNPTQYPAAYNNVFAVAATDSGDSYADYSQYGPHCDISAPGGEMSPYFDMDGIWSTVPTYATTLSQMGFGQNYCHLAGTSMAAPHVAGLAALVWAADPAMTPGEVQSTIEDTADDRGPTGRDDDYGHGRINTLAAVQLALTGRPIGDLLLIHAVTSTTHLTATLAWTAPQGADRIALRHSTVPLDDDSWDSATVIDDNLAADASGSVATIPWPAETVYFAIRQHLPDGTWVRTSNNVFWPS
ncbi:MAG: S8 family serine peptidase, partial [Anaerolineae bacterium]|nr:S8 family serine peptidase [Anaerolineae bacterium]